MRKIRKGDEVVVLTGKDKSRKGVVLSVQPGGLVVVDGINMARKHVRPNPMKGDQGGFIDKAMPMSISKVSLVNGVQPGRVGFKVLKDGRKVRAFKSNDEVVDAK